MTESRDTTSLLSEERSEMGLSGLGDNHVDIFTLLRLNTHGMQRFITILDASLHLHQRACLSVGWLVWTRLVVVCNT